MASKKMADSKKSAAAEKANSLRDKYKDKVEEIKAKVSRQRASFRPNYERYDHFYQFTHQTTLTQQDIDTLEAVDRPVLEYNIVNAGVSRLCGEYSKQEPEVYASAKNGQQVDERTVAVVEGHFRHILTETNKKNGQYAVYKDQLSGGMSCWKIYTQYRNPRSFEQDIILERVYHPTLCGFDLLAQDPTKKDAEWYYEIFPMLLSVFKQKHPDIDTSDISFYSGQDNVWAYSEDGEKVIVVCDFYEKKYESIKIIELANGQVLSEDEYEKFVKNWGDRIEQIPIIKNERETTEGYFCRYRLIENQVFEYVETDFTEPNLIFVDGDSSVTKEGNEVNDIVGAKTQIKQFIKPYVYHAKDHQRTVNLAGQTIANYLENLVQHKFMMSQESLPDQPAFQKPLKNVQKADVVIYKGLAKGENGEIIQLPPPQPVPEIPLTPVATDIFNNAIVMLQNILGSYDAALGIQNQELSGIAIVEAATQSNAAAMPYIVSNMNALNQVAQVILNLIPKIYKTPTTIPVRIQGEKHAQYLMVNGEGGPSLQYDSSSLGIEVKAGVSFAIAKSRAFNQLTMLMKVNPVFAQFINEEGLDILLDNLEFYGIDVVRDKANAFMEKLKQQQAQQQQAALEAQQNNPQLIAAQAAQTNAEANMIKAQSAAQQNETDIKTATMQTAVKVMQIDQDKKKNQTDIAIELIKAQADKRESRSNLEIAIIDALRKSRDQEHKEIKDIIELNQSLQDSSFNQALSMASLTSV